METIQYDNKKIEIIRKNVKNANLRIYPDTSIRLSVPYNSTDEQIKRFIHSKNLWINKKIKEKANQNRLSTKEYVSGEDIILNGKRYMLKVVIDKKRYVKIVNNKIIEMHITNKATTNSKKNLLNDFYKSFLRKKIEKYLAEWQEKTKICIDNYTIRNMQTRWGSYNRKNNSIVFNLQLAKKKNKEIEYVVIHEMLHSIENKHNDNFKNLLTKYFPRWEKYQKDLNEYI